MPTPRRSLMHGPPLTTREIASSLASSLARLERRGMSHRDAIEAVTREHNVERVRVEWLLGRSETRQTVEASR
jgi:hypothetical protein